jgi:hypothetical protein
MDSGANAKPLQIALQRYRYAVGKMPCPGSFGSIHMLFKELSDHHFQMFHKPWLNPYELAAVTNYTAMFGTDKRNHKPLFALDKPLNEFKRLWKLAEESNSYSDNPAYIAAFILRIVYQQLPYVIHPHRIPSMFSRMSRLFSTGAMDAYVKARLGFGGKDFFDAAEALFGQFSRSAMYEEKDLAAVMGKDTLTGLLATLSSTRTQRLTFHRGKLEVKSPSEKPYELNSLLKYPMIRHGGEIYCPYPQLIGYAATRGLFFRFSEEDKEKFREPFVESVELYVKETLKGALPTAEILTEKDERSLGWAGKTNDVTAITGDCALLIECKLSGLYVESKRLASPHSIISDVRKQIADPKERRGLFQLYDKCQAIQARLLPPKLMEKYNEVRRVYPVLLLFDEIQMANKAEIMGNIIQDELTANGARGFKYQIWHLEELDWLAALAKSAYMDWIAEKFSTKNEALDLSAFLADKAGGGFLKLILYLPEGDTKAIQILQGLVAKESACPPHPKEIYDGGGPT